MSQKTTTSPFLEHFTKPQETPHTPIISAKVEVLIIQFNAIAKVLRTKKFRELESTNYQAWSERFEIYQEAQDQLAIEIDVLGNSVGGTVHIWDGAI